MDDALGVDQDLDLPGIHVKEPAGLDDLQALVDQGRGVDGDLGPHGPGRVAEGVCRRDIGEVGSGSAAEGTAGGGEPDLRDPVAALSVQGLEDGAVFTVDRQNGNTPLRGQGHDDMAGRDQGLLVGQGDLLAALDRGDGRADTHHAHDGGDKEFVSVHGRNLEKAVHPGQDPDIQVSDAVAQVLCGVLLPQHGCLRMKFADLFFHEIHAAPGTERDDFNISLFPGDIQGLSADGTGGT